MRRHRNGHPSSVALAARRTRWRCAPPPRAEPILRLRRAAEAALREIEEETGLRAELLPGPSLPLPSGFPHGAPVAPWWVVEMDACADNHTREPHRHIDHVYVARVADGAAPGGVHEVRWFAEQEAAEVEGLSEDSRLQVKQLFAMIADGSLRLAA
ncbi:NUDIX domain-containing protein [Streptomyces sp. NPDC054865]